MTGISGAGKSEVCKQLKLRGYSAFGTDEEGISAWWENASARCVGWPRREVWGQAEWQATHSWRMSRERLEEIAVSAGSSTVFVCGTAANENEVWDVFSQVICLYLDDESELRRRLKRRTGNAFGSEPHELEAVLGWHKAAKSNYIGFGATMVDANQPLEKVVDDVLGAVAGME